MFLQISLASDIEYEEQGSSRLFFSSLPPFSFHLQFNSYQYATVKEWYTESVLDPKKLVYILIESID